MTSRLADVEQTLDLPPGYTLVALRELGDAFAHGCDIAAEAGAGTLVWVRRYDLVEFAVVLEPDEPLVSARRALFAGMNAVADAIAAHCPPEREVSFDWPDAISVRWRVAGRGAARLAGGLRRGRGACVAGVRRHAARRRHGACRGGAGRIRRFAVERRFRDGRHRRDHRQLRPSSHDRVRPLERARVRGDRTGLSGAASRRKAGERRTIDLNGDLLVSPPAGSGPPERTSLVDALAKVAWYDPQARGPKLG